MPVRGAVGIVSRLPADWQASDLQGGRVFQAAVAGQLSYAELFNNATDGSYLYVYGLTCNTVTLNALVVESYKGQKGTPNGLQGSIQFDQPAGFGSLGNFTSPICVGTELGAITSDSSQGFWPYSYPFGIVPPGYSVSLHAANVNVAIETAWWWLPLKG